MPVVYIHKVNSASPQNDSGSPRNSSSYDRVAALKSFCRQNLTSFGIRKAIIFLLLTCRTLEAPPKMYRPTLLLPSDDFRGGLDEVLLLVGGPVAEGATIGFVGLLAWGLASLKASTEWWGCVFLPLLVYDGIFSMLGFRRFFRSFHWLLDSERRGRALDLLGGAGRIVFTTVSTSAIFGWVPTFTSVIVAGVTYVAGMICNAVWAKDSYVWTRLQLLDLTTFVTALSVYLKHEQVVTWSWHFALALQYMIGVSIIGIALVMFYLADIENHDLDTRVFVRLFLSLVLLGGVAIEFAVFFFSRWMEGAPNVSTWHWGGPLISLELLVAFFSVLVTVVVASQHVNSDELAALGGPTSSGSNSPSAIGPALVANQPLLLERVGATFFRLGPSVSIAPGTGVVCVDSPSGVPREASALDTLRQPLLSSMERPDPIVESEPDIEAGANQNRMNTFVPRPFSLKPPATTTLDSRESAIISRPLEDLKEPGPKHMQNFAQRWAQSERSPFVDSSSSSTSAVESDIYTKVAVDVTGTPSLTASQLTEDAQVHRVSRSCELPASMPPVVFDAQEGSGPGSSRTASKRRPQKSTMSPTCSSEGVEQGTCGSFPHSPPPPQIPRWRQLSNAIASQPSPQVRGGAITSYIRPEGKNGMTDNMPPTVPQIGESSVAAAREYDGKMQAAAASSVSTASEVEAPPVVAGPPPRCNSGALYHMLSQDSQRRTNVLWPRRPVFHVRPDMFSKVRQSQSSSLSES
eukprot:GHVT01075517.1.p1 GENE.GHVT01075517.1~~GHVT01075517.1.p1  ORF type:complete len:747 (+),score=64.86 GHVT01075517.1:1046-3286(+)